QKSEKLVTDQKGTPLGEVVKIFSCESYQAECESKGGSGCKKGAHFNRGAQMVRDGPCKQEREPIFDLKEKKMKYLIHTICTCSIGPTKADIHIGCTACIGFA
ncbi:hypothetical protein D6829_00500, partial [Candidatus Pacearchaeota archaeon]